MIEALDQMASILRDIEDIVRGIGVMVFGILVLALVLMGYAISIAGSSARIRDVVEKLNHNLLIIISQLSGEKPEKKPPPPPIQNQVTPMPPAPRKPKAKKPPRYIIEGVYEADHQEAIVTVEAKTDQEAYSQGREMGIMISDVRKV